MSRRETPPPNDARGRAREPYGAKPVFMALREVLKLPPEQRDAELMDRIEHVWQLALDRQAVNKHGETIPNPDGATALRAVEVAKALMGTDATQQKRANLLDLAMFKTTERKAG
jgi:hypothetical protein